MKHIGMSEICGAWLRQAHIIHPIFAVQQEWSLLTRSLEVELLPVCSELGVGVVAYSPLARNLLTAPEKPSYSRDFRFHNPRYSEENFSKNVAIAEKIKVCLSSILLCIYACNASRYLNFT